MLPVHTQHLPSTLTDAVVRAQSPVQGVGASIQVCQSRARLLPAKSPGRVCWGTWPCPEPPAPALCPQLQQDLSRLRPSTATPATIPCGFQSAGNSQAHTHTGQFCRGRGIGRKTPAQQNSLLPQGCNLLQADSAACGHAGARQLGAWGAAGLWPAPQPAPASILHIRASGSRSKRCWRRILNRAVKLLQD